MTVFAMNNSRKTSYRTNVKCVLCINTFVYDFKQDHFKRMHACVANVKIVPDENPKQKFSFFYSPKKNPNLYMLPAEVIIMWILLQHNIGTKERDHDAFMNLQMITMRMKPT